MYTIHCHINIVTKNMKSNMQLEYRASTGCNDVIFSYFCKFLMLNCLLLEKSTQCNIVILRLSLYAHSKVTNEMIKKSVFLILYNEYTLKVYCIKYILGSLTCFFKDIIFSRSW